MKANKRMIISEILNRLEHTKPTEQDKSLMIKLTPLEILNIAKMGAEYWTNALKNGTIKSIDEVCQFHVDIALEILKHTDPERFINQN